jgi:hypothetical protein
MQCCLDTAHLCDLADAAPAIDSASVSATAAELPAPAASAGLSTTASSYVNCSAQLPHECLHFNIRDAVLAMLQAVDDQRVRQGFITGMLHTINIVHPCNAS